MRFIWNRLQVTEIINKNVVTVAPDATIEEAALLLQRHKVEVLPVVDENDKLVGIITAMDLFNVLLQRRRVDVGDVRQRLVQLDWSNTQGCRPKQQAGARP